MQIIILQRICALVWKQELRPLVSPSAPHGLVRTTYQPSYLLLHLIYGYKTLLLLQRTLAEKERGGVRTNILCDLASPSINNIPIIWTTVEQQYFNYSQSLDIKRRQDINLQHQDLLFCLFQAAKCRIERLHSLALSQEEWRACPHRHIYIVSAVKSQVSSIQHTDSSSGP